jgi:hypothetical protein
MKSNIKKQKYLSFNKKTKWLKQVNHSIAKSSSSSAPTPTPTPAPTPEKIQQRTTTEIFQEGSLMGK